MIHLNNKFKSDYIALIIDVFTRGDGLPHFLADVHCCKKTFYNWIDRYKSFKEAYAVALIKGEAFWLSRLQENVCNPDFNLNAAKFILSNRFGVTSNRKQRIKWLDSKDLIGSFDKLMKQLKDDDASVHELKDSISLLLSLADLKEREELTERIKEIEEKLKSRANDAQS